MSNGGYITANLVTEVTGTAARAAYPTANLHDGIGTLPCWWSSGTPTITVAASGDCTGIAICCHNLVAGATLTVNSVAVTVTQGRSIWHKFPAATNSATIAINNSGTTVWIGEIVMGVATSFSRNFNYGYTQTESRFADEHVTEFGQLYAYPKFSQEVVSLPFGILDATTKTQLQELYRAANGPVTPVLVIPDLADTPCVFGRLGASLGVTASNFNLYSSTLEIRSETTPARLS